MDFIRQNPLLLAPVVLLELSLLAVGLIDIIRRDRNTIRGGKKWPWVLVIVILNLIGPIIYLTIGRKED